jgi:hypothetical protein
MNLLLGEFSDLERVLFHQAVWECGRLRQHEPFLSVFVLPHLETLLRY